MSDKAIFVRDIADGDSDVDIELIPPGEDGQVLMTREGRWAAGDLPATPTPGTTETAENALVRSAGSGGNPRGVDAVDLQRSRNVDEQVASGDAAVICGGQKNEASGDWTHIGGGADNSVGPGVYSSVLGASKGISVTGNASHAIGYNSGGFPIVFPQDLAFIVYGLRAYLHAPNTAPTDADLKNSSISFWLDETNDTLTFRVKYSDGTLKTGTIALT